MHSRSLNTESLATRYTASFKETFNRRLLVATLHAFERSGKSENVEAGGVAAGAFEPRIFLIG